MRKSIKSANDVFAKNISKKYLKMLFDIPADENRITGDFDNENLHKNEHKYFISKKNHLHLNFLRNKLFQKIMN